MTTSVFYEYETKKIKKSKTSTKPAETEIVDEEKEK